MLDLNQRPPPCKGALVCCQVSHGLANPAYLSGFLYCGLRRVAGGCIPGGIRVVSRGPGLSTVSGIMGPALCTIVQTNFYEKALFVKADVAALSWPSAPTWVTRRSAA